ncbi:hypothetical protein QYF36_025117 [Acer negundo]|nr:hypothetical protein QYF36_025117 [Acer negundo]
MRVKTLKAKYCALHELLSQSGFGNDADNEEELTQDDATDHENVESFIDLLNGIISNPNMEFQSQDTEEFGISSSQPPKCSTSNMASAIAAMAPKLDGLINVLSYKKEVTDLQAKLKSELNNIEGLSRLQLFRATNMLDKDHNLLRVFFTLSTEEKKIYVIDLLKHRL